MPKQRKSKVRGEMADGSFDISDLPESPEDLEGAIAEAFGDEAREGAPEHEGAAEPSAEPPADPEAPADAPTDAPSDRPTDPPHKAGRVPDEEPPRPVDAGLIDADEEVARLVHERDEAIEARKRAMADFVNYRRRADENEVRARQDGVASVVRSLMPMLDHFDLALGQEEAEMSTEQLMEGVRMVHAELTKALEHHLVRLIAPDIGDDFDPNEHQAVMRDCTDERPPNTIALVLQVGYAVNDMILRPASVSVTAPAEEDGG